VFVLIANQSCVGQQLLSNDDVAGNPVLVVSIDMPSLLVRASMCSSLPTRSSRGSVCQ
jgi:hypothetical protein